MEDINLRIFIWNEGVSPEKEETNRGADKLSVEYVWAKKEKRSVEKCIYLNYLTFNLY